MGGTDKPVVWFSPESLDLLHRMFDDLSPETLHKMMNPMCGQCMAERGRAFIAQTVRQHPAS